MIFPYVDKPQRTTRPWKPSPSQSTSPTSPARGPSYSPPSSKPPCPTGVKPAPMDNPQNSDCGRPPAQCLRGFPACLSASTYLRGFQAGLSSIRLFTGTSGLSIFNLTVFWYFRATYPQAHYLRGLPACMPANARLTRAAEATGLACPKDAGFRPTDHSVLLRPAGLCLTISLAHRRPQEQSVRRSIQCVEASCIAGARVKYHRPKRGRRDRRTATTPAPQPA